jgi:transcriptional regulator with XRE-family HTH domain
MLNIKIYTAAHYGGGVILDTLDRITQLLDERGWTKYKLAKECGMSLSSVSNMFRRHTSPTVATIESICNALGISLSQFFDVGNETNTVHLTDEQMIMFNRWSSLTATQKELLFSLIDNMK